MLFTTNLFNQNKNSTPLLISKFFNMEFHEKYLPIDFENVCILSKLIECDRFAKRKTKRLGRII